ncbi:MAG: hypothetical protein IJ087_15310 [Eggerthellaceae bacterium]|nr:hypothetical protein [Eggerthellaceae bacterium]
MGFFSKLKTIGEGVNDVAKAVGRGSVTDYGEPAYTLYTSMRLGDMHRRIDITDEAGEVKYYTKSSVVAIKGKTDVMDAAGNVVAHLEKRPVSLHEKHFITMADGRSFTLSNELFHVVKDVTNIEELGWQLRGNIIGLCFNLLDTAGQPIATVDQKMVSVHDKYSIDLYQPEHEQVVVAIVIQLEKMMEARRDNESSSSFSFGVE